MEKQRPAVGEGDEAKQATLENDLASLNKTRNTAVASAEEMENQIKDLEQQLADVGGIRVKGQRAKVGVISLMI